MSELANFSVETDHIVLLSFKDGRKLRVSVSQLARYLAPRDLAEVRSALKLRRDFIRNHMPKLLMVLAAGGLIALLVAGGRQVALLLHPPAVAPAPQSTGIVRSFGGASPSVSASPQPKVQGDAVAVVPKRSARSKPHPYLPVALRHPARAAAAVTPIPVATPAPQPPTTPGPVADSTQPQTTSPSPSPSPAPTLAPTPPDQGQVLGDSTGPGDPPAK